MKTLLFSILVKLITNNCRKDKVNDDDDDDDNDVQWNTINDEDVLGFTSITMNVYNI